MAGITHAPVISSISSTLLRILPIADATNGGGANVQGAPSSQAHGDNVSVSTKSSCSSCVSSCPSNNNKNNEQGLFGNYRLVKTLGVGEFGKVKLGIHSETKQKVAIKVIKKKDAVSKIAKVEREIQILKSLRHPHIVKLIEVVETDTHIGIVLEYASGGELFEYVLSHRSLDEDTAKNLFAQLISSVNHMHGKGIAHRDLKLENLLFLDSQQTHLVVSDFGFSNNDKKDFLSTCCGSPTYAAPELIYPSNGYRGEAADIWSCGVILYCMICGYLPFDDDPDNIEGANILQLYRYIRSRSLSFPGFVSDDAQDLIRHMLQPDPVYRCTINFVINHPWLNSH
ncbi:kinase-like domain-containing protein, partial [Chlamydoabsidia padenii]